MEEPRHQLGWRPDVLRAVTIRQILDAKEAYEGAGFKINGIKLEPGSKLKIVAQLITETPNYSTKRTTLELDDGTGRIKASWSSRDSEVPRIQSDRELNYVRVIVRRINSGKSRWHNSVDVHACQSVQDPNEVFSHILEAITVTLCHTRGLPPQWRSSSSGESRQSSSGRATSSDKPVHSPFVATNTKQSDANSASIPSQSISLTPPTGITGEHRDKQDNDSVLSYKGPINHPTSPDAVHAESTSQDTSADITVDMDWDPTPHHPAAPIQTGEATGSVTANISPNKSQAPPEPSLDKSRIATKPPVPPRSQLRPMRSKVIDIPQSSQPTHSPSRGPLREATGTDQLASSSHDNNSFLFRKSTNYHTPRKSKVSREGGTPTSPNVTRQETNKSSSPSPARQHRVSLGSEGHPTPPRVRASQPGTGLNPPSTILSSLSGLSLRSPSPPPRTTESPGLTRDPLHRLTNTQRDVLLAILDSKTAESKVEVMDIAWRFRGTNVGSEQIASALDFLMDENLIEATDENFISYKITSSGKLYRHVQPPY